MRRTLDELRRDQEAIMDAYRAERAAIPASEPRPASGYTGNDFAYGRVTQIIDADAEYGPHLVVMRQRWSGIPPVAAACGTGPLRCYPVGGRTVSDFTIDELIRLSFVAGAIVAERLA